MTDEYEVLKVEADGAVLFVTIDAPPMNMLGPELVRDLVSLVTMLDQGEPFRVVVFRSADPDYFISHVDVTKVAAYRQEAARLTGEASIALLFRRIAETKAVTIAQIEGRARGAAASSSSTAICASLRVAAQSWRKTKRRSGWCRAAAAPSILFA